MAHAMELVPECAILKEHPLLTFKEGPYSYRIERKADASIYSVSDGQQTVTAPVVWAFGLGLAGQTYVFLLNGEYYESRVSYYRALDGLDLTIGASNRKPTNLTQAAGEILAGEEKAHCFGCHATNAAQGAQLTVDRMTAGVQCERCHGPTGNHLQGLKQGDSQLAHMNDLRKLSTEDLSNFCGQCHRTWDEIAAGGKLGIANVRFQPYRLTNSKCYDSEDARISCVACHDPHKEIDRTAADYDSRCQACHAGAKPRAHACRVAQSNCVSCHMPKIEMPGSHYKFTDHHIRIARANESYPE
jgi:Zn finger protein HypA/HybF involved in hydrogenase expression